MSVLKSRIVTRSPRFQANDLAVRALVEDLRAQLAVYGGHGAASTPVECGRRWKKRGAPSGTVQPGFT